jgi:predicted kinase
MTRLILMCGLPGAGKTTQARHLAATLPAIRLSPDEWLTALALSIFDHGHRHRVEQQLWAHAQDLLRLGQDVILENGFWGRTERDDYRDTARALGATVHLHYLDTPLDVLKHRRRDLLTADQMDDCAALFDTPDATELATYDPPITPATAP